MAVEWRAYSQFVLPRPAGSRNWLWTIIFWTGYLGFLEILLFRAVEFLEVEGSCLIESSRFDGRELEGVSIKAGSIMITRSPVQRRRFSGTHEIRNCAFVSDRSSFMRFEY